MFPVDANYNYSSRAFSGSQFPNDNNEENMSQIANPISNAIQRRPFEQSLRPFTIKQILEANEPKGDESLTIDGKEIGQVTIIGVITHIDIQTIHTSYIIDDGTSQITVKVYNSMNDNTSTSPVMLHKLKEQMYVRVIGRIIPFKGQRTITGHALIPIQDYNEITMHLAEVIYVHLLNTDPSCNNNHNYNKNINNLNNFNNNNYNVNNMNNMNHNNNTQLDDGYHNVASNMDQKILSIVSRDNFASTEEGCSMEDLCKALPDENVNQIREAIQRLTDDGSLYTTIDDEHIKSSLH